MAYAKANLRLLGGVPGQQIFLYQSTDLLSVVVASGYFNSAAADYNLTTGDIIIARCGTGGTHTIDLLVATYSSSTATVINGS